MSVIRQGIPVKPKVKKEGVQGTLMVAPIDIKIRHATLEITSKTEKKN